MLLQLVVLVVGTLRAGESANFTYLLTKRSLGTAQSAVASRRNGLLMHDVMQITGSTINLQSRACTRISLQSESNKIDFRVICAAVLMEKWQVLV